MRKLRVFAFAFGIAFFFTIALGQVSSSVIERSQYESKNHGLYNSSDRVVVLNVTTIKSSIYGSERSWLVEFYNSWCGFCTRFAPTWKSLANNTYAWKNIVAIAAIDCADDDNSPICREYDVTHYPALRFFSVKAVSGHGVEIPKGKDMTAIRNALVRQLIKEQQEERGSTWPNIVPYRSPDLKNIWKGTPHNIEYYIFIFERVESNLGIEVILDLNSVDRVRIRRVTSDNELLRVEAKVMEDDLKVLAIARDNSQEFIKITIPTRAGIRKQIVNFMITHGLTVNVEDIPEENPDEWLRGELQKDHSTHIGSSKSDKAYQVDIENALYYSLNHEVSLYNNIVGEQLKALKNYIKILAAHFPNPQKNKNVFLRSIYNLIADKEILSGQEFQHIVKERLLPILSTSKDWIGCKGSAEHYRGYPCGMWTLFHALTVDLAYSNENVKTEEFSAVLIAMRDYIHNFFGCFDCAKHFVAMSKELDMVEVESYDQNILWLWRAHNQVNRRLSGDETEDPEHKKILYPSKEHCPSCWFRNGTFNEVSVLKYLKDKYVQNRISQQDAYHFQAILDGDDNEWGVSLFDMSIFIVIYIISIVIIFLVCLKFIAKKKNKRKVSFPHLFTKV